MENIFKYYEFSDFFLDVSGVFSENEISYSVLNETHFLIFEKKNSSYNLYVSKYHQKKGYWCQKTRDFRAINRKL